MANEITALEPVAAEPVAVEPVVPELALEMLANTPADVDPARVYLSRLAPGSRPTMERALAEIARTLRPGGPEGVVPEVPWGLLRYRHVAALRAQLAARYLPATVNRHLAALRGVLREARKLGLMSRADCDDACEVESVPVDPNAEPAGRALDEDEVRRLIAVCDPATPSGARDGALLALLFGGGLRRAEVASVQLAHLDRNAAAVTVVRGKGGKTRRVPLPRDAALLVQAWLVERGREAGPLMASFHRGGGLKRRPDGTLWGISASGVYGCLQEVARVAGVEDVSPHDGRRTRITQMLSEGQSIAVIQKIAGHRQASTTARYDRSGMAAMQAAAEAVPMVGG